jgi:hypothetical protein
MVRKRHGYSGGRMSDRSAEEMEDREDAYSAFAVPLIVLVTSAVVGALGVGFWLGSLVGAGLSLLFSLAYRRWQRFPVGRRPGQADD